MSLLGDLLGYDHSGHDLLGEHRDAEQNCIICGVSAILHTKEMEVACMRKMFTRPVASSKPGGGK